MHQDLRRQDATGSITTPMSGDKRTVSFHILSLTHPSGRKRSPIARKRRGGDPSSKPTFKQQGKRRTFSKLATRSQRTLYTPSLDTSNGRQTSLLEHPAASCTLRYEAGRLKTNWWDRSSIFPRRESGSLQQQIDRAKTRSCQYRPTAALSLFEFTGERWVTAKTSVLFVCQRGSPFP